MSNRHSDDADQRQIVPPKSPAEALEPKRSAARKGSRPRRKARRLSPAFRILNTVLTLTVTALVVAAGSAFWIAREVNQPGPAREAKLESVRKGDGARDVAARLESSGAISSQHLFIVNHMAHQVLGWFGVKPLQIKAGEFEIPPGASLKQVAEILNDGRSTMYRVTIPEGLTTAQIINRLKADTNLQGDIAVMPGEGTLLPDTYKFSKGMTRQQLVDLMHCGRRVNRSCRSKRSMRQSHSHRLLRKKPVVTTSETAWRLCLSTACGKKCACNQTRRFSTAYF
jgi:UPF0755 protein